MSTDYVKSTGLDLPEFQDIKEDLEADFQEVFGE